MKEYSVVHLHKAFKDLLETSQLPLTLKHERGKGYKLLWVDHKEQKVKLFPNDDYWRKRKEMCRYLEGLTSFVKVYSSFGPVEKGRTHSDYVRLCSLAANKPKHALKGLAARATNLAKVPGDVDLASLKNDYRNQIAFLLHQGESVMSIEDAIKSNC